MDRVLGAIMIQETDTACPVCGYILREKQCEAEAYHEIGKIKKEKHFVVANLLHCNCCGIHFAKQSDIDFAYAKSSFHILLRLLSNKEIVPGKKCVEVISSTSKCIWCLSDVRLTEKFKRIVIYSPDNPPVENGYINALLPYCDKCKAFAVGTDDSYDVVSILQSYVRFPDQTKLDDQQILRSFKKQIGLRQSGYDPIIKWKTKYSTSNHYHCNMRKDTPPDAYITKVKMLRDAQFTQKWFYIVDDFNQENAYANTYHIIRSISRSVIDSYLNKRDIVSIDNNEYQLLYVEETERLKEETRCQTDFLSRNPVQIYLHSTSPSCKTRRHHMEYITASVLGSFKNEPVNIGVSYCWHCNKFFLGAESFQSYVERYGNIVVKLHYDEGYHNFSVNNNGIDFGNLKLKSELALRGYTVRENDSIRSERHSILSSLIAFKIMEKRDIIDHIEWCIRIHWRHAKAVNKWQDDLNFLNNLDIDEQRKVYGEIIKKIKRRSP